LDLGIWTPRVTWYVTLLATAVYSALQVANLFLAELGLLELGLLLLLGSPAGIFYNFVRELGGPSGDEVVGEPTGMAPRDG
jgi:hypothetical protein